MNTLDVHWLIPVYTGNIILRSSLRTQGKHLKNLDSVVDDGSSPRMQGSLLFLTLWAPRRFIPP